MSADSDPSDPLPHEQFPRDLAALDRAPFEIPRALDEAVLHDARAYFGRQRSRRMILRLGALATAAAAVVAIVVHLASPPAQTQAPSVALKSSGPSGTVDIVDALKLAKRIRAGTTSASGDDVNRDGRIDQHDVDAIAMAAVKLPEARVQ